MLFVQGAGDGAHDRWDAKLVASLERALGEAIRYPRMPDEANPRYAAWKHALLGELAGERILIGHSVGATVLLNVLAERPAGVHPSAVFLIAAPFIGDGGWDIDDIVAPATFAIDAPVFLYHGDADETVPFSHLARYAAAIPGAVKRVVAGGDHQLHDDLEIVARDIRHAAR